MDSTSTPSAAEPGSQTAPSQLQFTGNAKEYFGIWIVNILLTLLTLGIYSAWATVRTKQYFYGHTVLDGHRFDYLATPIQILKGRLLAVGLFVIYSVVSGYFPLVGAMMAFALVFLVPWMINQGLKFSMRMTRYRNIRFAFKGNLGEAMVNFVVLPFVSIFTLYLLMPWVLKRIDAYIHSNIRYGDKPVQVQLEGKEYYVAALLVILLGILVMMLLGLAFSLVGGININPGELGTVNFGVFLIVPLYLFVISALQGIYQAQIRNHILNNAQIEDVAEFESNLAPQRYALILATNAAAIVLTAGLAFPWAKVRKVKALAGATQVMLLPGADQVLDNAQQADSSFAEEAANVFDVDISLT
ncbi:YjgN family protein [Pseudoalteromonas sp. PPB1]|uniref:YjgN family protein n=1 Tax=Pseudoalteromonas sp. PPB1 TaxID=2756136 RepID=UPI001891C2B6|nr:YjgN family protein [Pseudoalteromonas sp. PPB1]